MNQQEEPTRPDPAEQNGFQRVRRRPTLNVPGIVLVSIAILAIIHYFYSSVLGILVQRDVLFAYSFMPIRFDPEVAARFGGAFPGGIWGALASSVTYGFLHASWTHLLMNCLWLLIFGSALAKRVGGARFIILSLLGSIGGAILHYFTNIGSAVPMVGASAAISAQMACAARFAFVPYGPLGIPRNNHPSAYLLPSLSIVEMLRNRQVVAFLCVWFVINLVVGVGSNATDGQANVAWEAHIGGFLAGLLLFPLLDPVKRSYYQT